MTEACFNREGDRFRPTDLAESPWGAGMLHGGPPAGLLARAVEQFVDSSELQVARLTVDLFRPVPTEPLEVRARVIRDGRRIRVVDATLLASGVEVSGARAVLLRASELSAPGSVPSQRPAGPEGIEPSGLGGPRPGQAWRPGFHSHIEIRRLPRPDEGAPAAAWFRIPFAMVDGEELTPLQRLAETCDFVHGTSNGGRRNELEFINVDSTISIQRLPAGEWICLQSEKSYEGSGIGVASALIWDEQGFVGHGTQTILHNPGRR
jgi:hypothetical protein